MDEKGKSIRVHEDLIVVLERLRKKHEELTYGYANLSYYELTGILAKKISVYIK